MGWMKNKRRREREAKQSRKLEAEWWYEPNIEIEHVPEQLGEEEITPPIDNEYLINNALDNDDLNTEWYIRLSWDTCTEQLKQLKIAQRNGGNSLTNAQSQYAIKKTELRNELETAVDTLTAPGTLSKNKISGTSYNLSHGIFLNNLNNNDIQTIKTLGFNLIASTPARHTLESSIPAINADQAHDHGHRGQYRRLGVIDSNLDPQNNAFGCGPEEYSWLMDENCGKLSGYNFRAMSVGYYRECEAGEHPDACDWCRSNTGLCDSWPGWYSDTICDCGQAGDPWDWPYSCTEDVIDNDCSSWYFIYPIGYNPGIGVEEYAYGLSDHGHHVSSIVGGLPSQDSSGTVGVAPDSEIVHFKGTQGSISSLDVMAGVELAQREDPPLDAINMSFGSKDIPMWCYDPNNDGNYVDAKIIYSAELVNNAASANLLTIAAAGNSGPHGGVGKYWRSSVQPYGDFLYYYGSRGLLNDVLPGLDIYTWANNTTNNSNRKITRDWIGGGADCWIYWGLGHYFSIGVPGTAHKAITVVNADTSRWNPEPLPTLYNGSSRGPTLPYVFTCGGIPPSAGGEECQKRCIGADYADVDDFTLPMEPGEYETTFGIPGSNTPLYAVELDDVDDVTWDNTMITGYENAEVDEEMFNAFIILSTQDTAELFCASKDQTYVSHTETEDTVEMLDTYLDHAPEYSVGLIMGEGDDWYSGCHWMNGNDCSSGYGGFSQRNFFYGYADNVPNIPRDEWLDGSWSIGNTYPTQWDHNLPFPWGSGGVNTEYDDGTHSEDYNEHWVAWEQTFVWPGYLNKHCGVDDDACEEEDFWGPAGQSADLLANPIHIGPEAWRHQWGGKNNSGNWKCCKNHHSLLGWVYGVDPGANVHCSGPIDGPWYENPNTVCWNITTGYALKAPWANPNYDYFTPWLEGTGCGSKPPCSHEVTIMNNSNVDGDTYVTTADFYNGYDDKDACIAFKDLHGFCPTNSDDERYDYCRYDAWKRGEDNDYGCSRWAYVYPSDHPDAGDPVIAGDCCDGCVVNGMWIADADKCCIRPRVCLAQGLTDAQCDALEGAPCCKMSGSVCVGSQTLYPATSAYDSAVQRPEGYDNSWYHLGHALESVTCVEDIVGEVGDLFYITGEQPCEMVGRGAFIDAGEKTWNRECDDQEYNLMHDNSDYDMAAGAGLCSKGCWHYSEECGDLTGEYESVCSYVSSETCDCQPVTEPVEIGGNPYGWADKPDIAAPGTNICAAGLSGWDGYEYNHNAWGWDTGCTPSVPDDCCYGTVMTGTSMAAPHVTGAVGVIKGGNPDLSNDQVKEILFNTTTSMEINGVPYEDYQVGSGLLNVAAAACEECDLHPSWACCRPNGSCRSYLPWQCTGQGYTYHEGLDCSDVTCYVTDQGWALVSTACMFPNSDGSGYTPVATVYPDSVDDSLYSFDAGYVSSETLGPWTGYWLRMLTPDDGIPQASENCTAEPFPTGDHYLTAGWNMIGGPSIATHPEGMSVEEFEDPDGILIANTMYEYLGAAGYGQQPVDELYPWKGYWIKTREAGTITYPLPFPNPCPSDDYAMFGGYREWSYDYDGWLVGVVSVEQGSEIIVGAGGNDDNDDLSWEIWYQPPETRRGEQKYSQDWGTDPGTREPTPCNCEYNSDCPEGMFCCIHCREELPEFLCTQYCRNANDGDCCLDPGEDCTNFVGLPCTGCCVYPYEPPPPPPEVLLTSGDAAGEWEITVPADVTKLIVKLYSDDDGWRGNSLYVCDAEHYIMEEDVPYNGIFLGYQHFDMIPFYIDAGDGTSHREFMIYNNEGFLPLMCIYRNWDYWDGTCSVIFWEGPSAMECDTWATDGISEWFTTGLYWLLVSSSDCAYPGPVTYQIIGEWDSIPDG